MLTWLKRILGIAPATTAEVKVEAPAPAEATTAPAAPKTTTKKTSTKKATTTKAPAKKAEPKKADVLVDKPKDRKSKLKNGTFDAMKKTELLAYTKANGIAANSSMKKEDIILAIRNA